MDAHISPAYPLFSGDLRLRTLFQPPKELLNRIRWLFLMFSLINIVLLFPSLILFNPVPVLYKSMALGAFAILTGFWVHGYSRERFLPWHDILCTLSLLAVGVGVGDPRRALGLFYISLCFRSLYGFTYGILIRVVLYLAAYLGALCIASMPGVPGPLSPEALFPIAGIPVTAGVIFVLGSTLSRHSRALQREHVLAMAGAELAAAPDRQRIYDVSIQAALALFADLPDARVSLAIGMDDEMEIVASAGYQADEILGKRIHSSLLSASLEQPRESHRYVIRSQDLPALRHALEFEPREGTAFLAPLCVKDELRGILTARSSQVLPEESQDGLEALATLTVLALETMALSETRFRTLVQNSSDVIAILAPDTTIQFVSPSVERVFGFPAKRITGKKLSDLIHPEDVGKLRTTLDRLIRQPWANRELEYRMGHMDGPWRDVETKFNNLLSDPNVQGILLNTRDITERKALERKLVHQAFHDPLTRLANRSLFRNRVEHALARGDRHQTPIAVMYLDLDNFKDVNDSLGHKAGDQLLISVAQRLQACLRVEDTVARLGGDEFTVLLEDVKSEEDVVLTAERMVQDMLNPFVLEGNSVKVPASVGVAIGFPKQDTLDDLLRKADVALYEAKNLGKGRYQVYSPDMHRRAKARKDLESDLERALDLKQFQVYYQPVVQLHNGQITEVEALVRWAHPVRGLLSPVDFLPLAEETGLILPIEKWVLETACRQAKLWQVQGSPAHPLTVYVNLSTRQFQHSKLSQMIARILEDTQLNPSSLKLEITEDAIINDSRTSLSTLNHLSSLGVRLAIDDFGTSFSGLDYLRRIPIETLKINRTFIQGLGQSSEETAMVRALVAFAKALNLVVIGKGIETLEQVGELQTLGCDRGQGYYFSHPLSAEKASRLFAFDPLVREEQASAFLDTPLQTSLQ